MTREDYLRLFEQSLDVTPGSIEETQRLKSLKQWDSMALITFMVTVDEHLGSSISPEAIEKCETVADLLTLLGEKATG
jgi:acyl carrier protein